jgi:dTDP-4-amino-4,6-dideoxygalactose transaminase
MSVIPFLDLHSAYAELNEELDAALSRVLDGSWYILGSELEGFEEGWASYCEADHAVSVANGLNALALALRALDIGAGDEVIVPPNTYIATWLAVSALGARPVPVEPAPTIHLIEATRIERAITPPTKAFLPIHMYGSTVDLDAISNIVRQHNLTIIEDAAQAHGARYSGKRIGAHGDAICWSFYPGKRVGGFGDGGAITPNRSDVAEGGRLLRNYGNRTKYVHEVKGVNSRLDPLQAAMLRVTLRPLDNWNQRRSAIAEIYAEELKGTGLMLPKVARWAEPVWHLYVVRVQHRGYVQRMQAVAGIVTVIHYPIAPHMQDAYADLGIPADGLPRARKLAQEVLSLPIGPHLGLKDVRHVVGTLREVLI